MPPRITRWDTATGGVTHQIAPPGSLPSRPNGRYLAAMIDDDDAGPKLSVWRLGGKIPVNAAGPTPPAVRPR